MSKLCCNLVWFFVSNLSLKVKCFRWVRNLCIWVMLEVVWMLLVNILVLFNSWGFLINWLVMVVLSVKVNSWWNFGSKFLVVVVDVLELVFFGGVVLLLLVVFDFLFWFYEWSRFCRWLNRVFGFVLLLVSICLSDLCFCIVVRLICFVFYCLRRLDISFD